MWDAPVGWLDVLSHSHEVSAQATITLDGRQLARVTPDSWALSRELRGGQVVQELTLAVPDETAELLTDDPASPLQAYGQRVDFRVRITSAGTSVLVPMGVFRIETAQPVGGEWSLYPNGKWRRPSTLVNVTASDLLSLVADHDFITASMPPAGATTHTEIRRLVDGDMPVLLPMSARPVVSALWEGSRIDALLDVMGTLSAVACVNRRGQLEAVPETGTGHTLSVRAADPDGYTPAAATGLVDWRPEATRDGLYNGVIATGSNDDGGTVGAFAYETDGIMAWRSAGFGRVTYKHTSPLITSQARAQLEARTRLQSLMAGRGRTLTITTLPNPALDVLDTVEVTVPDTGRTIPALVTSIRLADNGPMTLTASVPWEVPIYG